MTLGLKMRRRSTVGACAGAVLLLAAAGWGLSNPVPTHGSLPADWGWGVAPFICLLLVIALFPVLRFSAHWWESNLNRLLVALGAGLATLGYLANAEGIGSAATAAAHALRDYLPFMILLGSLFVISGGVSLRAHVPGTPATNSIILAIGALAASLLGTTGASMLLIRPLLELNRGRTHVAHTVVFFIFIVSNTGGLLLPLGDPPLFLGYLRGVPFFWTLSMWPQWLLVNGALLVTYLMLDRKMWRRESLTAQKHELLHHRTVHVQGHINFLWLGGIVLAAVFLVPGKQIGPWVVMPWIREAVMVGCTMLSLQTTPTGIHLQNRFSFAPILEVAALFAGIFVAMQVPLRVLGHFGPDLGLHSEAAFFWCTGLLSSFLDNAPTYLVFLEVAQGVSMEPATIQAGADAALAATAAGVAADGRPAAALVALSGDTGAAFVRDSLLAAVSMGAVFMGANTYIGNGPNFMVRAIAEQSGVAMPSFFGYMRWSAAILLPLFILVTLTLTMW